MGNYNVLVDEDNIHSVNRRSCRDMLDEADKHVDFVRSLVVCSLQHRNPDFKKFMIKDIRNVKKDILLIQRKIARLKTQFSY